MEKDVLDFLKDIAGMKYDGESASYEGIDYDENAFTMENDEAVETLSRLIQEARDLMESGSPSISPVFAEVVGSHEQAGSILVPDKNSSKPIETLVHSDKLTCAHCGKPLSFCVNGDHVCGNTLCFLGVQLEPIAAVPGATL